MEKRVSSYQCCFCGKGIENTRWEPIVLIVGFPDTEETGKHQFLWTHVDCLGSHLHSSVPWLALQDYEQLPDD